MLFHHRRHEQYADWVTEGEPKVIWLSGLSIPETYTAALVQTTCRRYGWPLDKSSALHQGDQVHVGEPGGGAACRRLLRHGLYLEGAAWDVEHGVPLRQPPKVLVQELPILQIIPVELSKLQLQGTIRVPCTSRSSAATPWASE